MNECLNSSSQPKCYKNPILLSFITVTFSFITYPIQNGITGKSEKITLISVSVPFLQIYTW